MHDLTTEELNRYSRHLVMPEVGIEGQKKLKKGRVLCVGLGGLGSPLATYLAAAGVGTLGLLDFDVVDASNLHRQPLHGTKDVGRPKVESAAEKLRQINPHVDLRLHALRLTAENALQLFGEYDVIADGTDNFPTRYLVNDACVLSGKPNVYASVFRFEGQISVFWARHGPCYRCVFPDPPPPGTVPSCAEGGVLGVLPGIIGSLQAAEVIKLLLGIGQPLIGKLLLADIGASQFRTISLQKSATCPICGPRATVRELTNHEEFCGMAEKTPVPLVTPQQLQVELSSSHRPVLVDVRELSELSISSLQFDFHIPADEFPGALETIGRDTDLVIYCRSGRRSEDVTRYLIQLGFSRVRNLEGGINRWA